MLHKSKGRKLGRVRRQRKALLNALAISLVENGKIKTTEAKAKELRPYIEKLITRGKKSSIFSRRLLISRLGSGNVSIVKKIIDEIATKYKDRDGGYTRITKLSPRQGDGSSMAVIEFV